MKRLRCVRDVQDNYTKAIYKAGDVYEFEQPRAAEVLASVYFEAVEPAPAQQESTHETEPVSTAKDFPEMTIEELKIVASGLDVAFNSRTKKNELIEAVETAQAQAELDAAFERGQET